MILSRKELAKISAVAVTLGAAVFVVNMFLNYLMDLAAMKDEIPQMYSDVFDTMYSSCVSVAEICGGMMAATAAIMTIFFVINYVDQHSSELGILKALGYSSVSIAIRLWPFPAGALIGSLAGYLLSAAILPSFYRAQNSGIPFTVERQLHLALLPLLVLATTAVIALTAFISAVVKLRKSALSLITGRSDRQNAGRTRKVRGSEKIINQNRKERPFLKQMPLSVLKSRKLLVFFSLFASFCFTGNLQVSISMKPYTSDSMRIMMIVIASIIAAMAHLLSMSSLISGNRRSISLMRLMGYSQRECRHAVLDVYRPFAYFGVVFGSLYAYGLMDFMVNVLFRDVEGVEPYSFGWGTALFSAVVFAAIYECSVVIFSKQIEKIDPKIIMME
jgi:hypothetical protein